MNIKRIFLLLFAVCALTLCFTLAIGAATYRGECGANGDYLTWKLDTDTGELTISGEGEMQGNMVAPPPWFSYRSNIKKVTIDNGVTHIGSYAFCDHSSLTKVTIPDSVTSVGAGAFQYCSSLTKITLPDNVTEIDHWTFDGCESLAEITIPDSVTSIGYAAFYACTSLTEITIPDTVMSIDDWAFYRCSSLEKITVLSKTAHIYDNTETISDTATIYSHEGSTAEAYAKKYDRTFVVLNNQPKPDLRGDMNGDGALNYIICALLTLVGFAVIFAL